MLVILNTRAWWHYTLISNHGFRSKRNRIL